MAEALIALFMLTAMEIVLGIDNIVFITIVTGRLPESQRPHAWRMGLGLALILRLAPQALRYRRCAAGKVQLQNLRVEFVCP